MTTVWLLTLFRGSKLENFGNASKVASMIIVQLFIRRDCHDVKGIGCHNGRVDVAVVDQVAHHLKCVKYRTK